MFSVKLKWLCKLSQFIYNFSHIYMETFTISTILYFKSFTCVTIVFRIWTQGLPSQQSLGTLMTFMEKVKQNSQALYAYDFTHHRSICLPYTKEWGIGWWEDHFWRFREACSKNDCCLCCTKYFSSQLEMHTSCAHIHTLLDSTWLAKNKIR